ncbi:plasmid replication protein RepC [Rhizobium halophytocola]|uniref:Replication initiation protein RepC n=1 Tax=Rhizobium halophytocola TaxID=735519 RepID=A0ABS4DV77_9HYPH|nr:plasmid replication protein RepC [Rhizobium halophytocola]MBP1849575.1 replication initiation protein RepC [Rhizobium halophytocola]
MIERLATTPFGGGRMTARHFSRQKAVEDRQKALAEGQGGNDSGEADKWQLLRALTEARQVYGLGDRTIMLLEALVSFTTERLLDGRAPIIVFPSNRELALRARGMAPATIRRHLAALVDAGLIFRRDSANGKRFCRRDDKGLVEDAFGFDLAPLALKAGEIYRHAEEARLLARAIRTVKAEITLHRRDMAKIIEIALEEGRKGDWVAYLERLGAAHLAGVRHASLETLNGTRDTLVTLRGEVETAYLNSLSEQELSANDDQTERHYQNSNADLHLETKGYESKGGEGVIPDEPPKPERLAVSLKRVMASCPQIADYAQGGIRNWADLVKTADLVRSMLGVSPDAWGKARAAMGEQAAAVVMAALLERADIIRSPGGYLRDLTRKAQAGQFSIFPMLQALERRTE